MMILLRKYPVPCRSSSFQVVAVADFDFLYQMKLQEDCLRKTMKEAMKAGRLDKCW
jgi:hypothetical protein